MALQQGELFDEQTPGPARRVFLGWDRPLVEVAVEFLQAEYADEMAATLVVVPTRQSGRRLSDGLELAGISNRPQIVTPEFLYHPAEDSEPRMANAEETLLTWARTLQDADLADLRQMFPVDPAERSFSWAMTTAKDLLALRATLGENGLLLADVPKVFGAHFADTPRWEELGRLEAAACDRLEQQGLSDTATARRNLARDPKCPSGIRKIVVLAVPDPAGIALRALERLTDRAEITVAVFADEGDAERFDRWGLPTAAGWHEAQIAIPDPEQTIHLAADPPALTQRAAELVTAHADPLGMAAIAVADTDVSDELESALAERGIASHLPAGRPFILHEVHALLRLLADLLTRETFTAAAELARHPELLRLTGESYQEDGDPFDSTIALNGIDALAADHLPTMLADAGRHRTNPHTRHLLDFLGDWAQRLRSEALQEALPTLLASLYGERELAPGGADQMQFEQIAERLTGALAVSAGMKPADALEFTLTALHAEPLPEPRPEQAIDLQGWLEMLWEDSPHLIIAGANDGKLPEAMGGDLFLPNSARAKLGLRDSDSRLVRDSYLLSAMLAARNDGGRVDLLVGRFSSGGDPLRPSRLLMRCPAEELPQRALWLCGAEDAPPAPAPPWQPAWQLTPPPLADDSKLLQRISVTGFRSYLDCPYRFYLKFGLGMNEVETDKMEMNARDFGILCHAALEDFGEDASIRDSTDAEDIANYLIDRLERATQRRYRHRHSVPVAFQLESAKQRLAWAAEIQAAERASGWRIVDTEWSLHKEHDWVIGGLQVRGLIDRIEQHEQTGAYRVVDYKTSAKPKPPEQAHLKKLGATETEDDFQDWEILPGEKPMRWTDLQIPLYVLALQELRDAEQVQAGYFNLAPAKADTRIEIWDLDTAHLRAARQCAEGVANSIRTGRFWPPTERPAFDDFSGILFGNAVELSTAPAV